MIMHTEYLEEVKDFIRATPIEYLANKDGILSDEGTMDALWYAYQKRVEEYGCDPDWSFCEAMQEELGIDIPVTAVAPKSFCEPAVSHCGAPKKPTEETRLQIAQHLIGYMLDWWSDYGTAAQDLIDAGFTREELDAVGLDWLTDLLPQETTGAAE